MIRQATSADIEHVVTLSRAFHAYSHWAAIPLDIEAFTPFALNVIENGAIFLSDTGMIGGILSPAYFNPAYVVAVELFWWAPSGGGRALREAYEAWAQAQGASAVQCTAMSDAQLSKVSENYARGGYQPAEVAFIKRF